MGCTGLPIPRLAVQRLLQARFLERQRPLALASRISSCSFRGSVLGFPSRGPLQGPSDRLRRAWTPFKSRGGGWVGVFQSPQSPDLKLSVCWTRSQGHLVQIAPKTKARGDRGVREREPLDSCAGECAQPSMLCNPLPINKNKPSSISLGTQ